MGEELTSGETLGILELVDTAKGLVRVFKRDYHLTDDLLLKIDALDCALRNLAEENRKATHGRTERSLLSGVSDTV